MKKTFKTVFETVLRIICVPFTILGLVFWGVFLLVKTAAETLIKRLAARTVKTVG